MQSAVVVEGECTLISSPSMRFRLEHRRSEKNPAGARFSKVPVSERTLNTFSFHSRGGGGGEVRKFY